MIALGADHDIDGRLAAQDFRPLGLSDAACDNQRHPPAFAPALFFQLSQLAELGVIFCEARSRMWQVLRTMRSASSTPIAS